ncbi:YicC/YloC family endoribonuclease [Alkaliphilus peptidifermentans]|uniref:TIGR00255 family protein n=1 Tax=Alkaliphilus peptidifermentans DSM 18978 TaxID=1120976 RepID=A0A1G5JCM6_9FIRM|nr:YicC/YloC family endoribonuclease [Alkaliphilus peptidifermentans]SCY85539.1 TIGR00255 family protein [Alkaliphilus peptidifermentans DSM 18978]
MIRSMTGFGRGEAQSQQKKFIVELKSLNHRYMDTSIKMPKLFTYLEEKIRQRIKEAVKRGRVEVYINSESLGETDVKIVPDIALARQYYNALESINSSLNLKNDSTASIIAKFPEVIKVEKEEDNEDEIWSCMENALLIALDKLMEMRSIEGEQLHQDILKRLDIIGSMIKDIEERSPLIVNEYRQRLSDRIKEILDDGFDIDDNRVLMEVVIFADKSSIAEEIVRFYSHIKQFTKAMTEDDSVGRKLDFLIQEMNREVNTIGSKANDLTITNIVVNIKSELEKMREQVQNIE